MLRYVNQSDIPQCLITVELVKENFPGYKEAEFLEALGNAINHREAILVEEKGKAAGLLIFSYEKKELSFLAVHPDFRRQGTAKKLIAKMKSCFEEGSEIYVITFQEGDPKGAAARAAYYACGFTDDEMLTVFDYPCQKLICRI